MRRRCRGAVTDREADERRWSAWMTEAQAGNAESYERLLHELSPVIRGYLHARFGRFDALDDCVQECLLTIHQARHSYDSRRPFRPWLFAIVRNRTIDVMRKARRRTEFTENAVVNPDWNSEIDSRRLLGQLSKGLRETLLLTKLLGLSTAECAARQGISESLVKVRVHRGIRQLRSLWEAEAP